MYFIFDIDQVLRYFNNTFGSLLPLIYLVVGVWLGVLLVRMVVRVFGRENS